MSEITWDRLSQKDQAIIHEASRLTEIFNQSQVETAEDEAYQELEAAGVTVTELEDPDNWRYAVQTVYEKYGAQYTDIIDDIKNTKY